MTQFLTAALTALPLLLLATHWREARGLLTVSADLDPSTFAAERH